MTDGFWNGGDDLGAGFYDGTTPPADIAVTLTLPAPPTVSVVCDTVEGAFVDVVVDVVLPAPPDVEITRVITSGPTPPPVGPPGFSGDLDVILTTHSGYCVHLGDQVENLTTTRARKFGFENCTFELPQYDPRRFYAELMPFVDVQVIRNGITAFEGRITDPGLATTGTDRRRKVTCKGYASGFSDDATQHACFADQDLSRWAEPVQAASNEFHITAANPTRKSAGGIFAVVGDSATIPGDSFGEADYHLFGGVPALPAQAISSIWCKYNWRGLLDPRYFEVDVAPQYNLFKDPCAHNKGTWAKTLDEATAGTAAGQELSIVGNCLFDETTGACSGMFSFANDPSAKSGQACHWTADIDLPSDIQTLLAAGDLELSWSLMMIGSGTTGEWGADYLAMLASDSAGTVSMSEYLIEPGTPTLDASWHEYSGSVVVPQGSSQVSLYAKWAVGPGAPYAYRGLGLVFVTNGDPFSDYAPYGDGTLPGWQWTSKSHDSASCKTPVTMSEELLAQFAAADPPQSPLIAYLTIGDGPGISGTSMVRQFAAPANQSGTFTLEGNGSASRAFVVVENACGYGLTFKTPKDLPKLAKPYGLTIDDAIVFSAVPGTSDGALVTDCITWVAERAGVPASQRDIDATTLRLKMLNYDSATTLAKELADLDALLDWEWGFREGGTFYYKDPAPLLADPRHTYVLPYSQVTADNLGIQIADLCNGCVVDWTYQDGTPDEVMAHATAAQSSVWVPDDVDAYYHIDGPVGMERAQAAALVAAYIAEHCTPQVTGSLSFTGVPDGRGKGTMLVQDGNGDRHDVLTIREGEYVRLIDAPRQEIDGMSVQIARVTVDHQALTVSLDVGMNRRRLDRMLARLNAQILRR